MPGLSISSWVLLYLVVSFLENPALGVLWLYKHLSDTIFKNIIVLRHLKTWNLTKEEGKKPRPIFLTWFFVLWISDYPWMVITDAVSDILKNTTQFSQQLLWWDARAEVSLCYSGISPYLILDKMYNNNKGVQTLKNPVTLRGRDFSTGLVQIS